MFCHNRGIRNNEASRRYAHESEREALNAIMYVNIQVLYSSLQRKAYLNKCFATSGVITDERPLACMYPRMPCKVTPARKRFAAVFLVARMHVGNFLLLFHFLYLFGRRRLSGGRGFR